MQGATGYPFYNLSKLEFRTSQKGVNSLLDDPGHLAPNLNRYIDGFSPNVRAIMERFAFDQQIAMMAEKNMLFKVVQKFATFDLSFSHLCCRTSRKALSTRRTFADEHLRPDPEAPVQAADHGQRQGTLAAQHLIDPVGTADDRLEVLHRQAALLHPELDRLHRVGRVDRKVPGLVGLYQRGQDVQTIALRRARRRVRFHQRRDVAERRLVVGFGSNGTDVHDDLIQFGSMVCASIVSYC